MIHKPAQATSAFSLVELSIVLVILGPLVGGILAGQSLIRATELRAVATEYHRYLAATQAFRDKYFAIPGDMANATQFWGRLSSSNCVTNSAAAVTANGTCDGDAQSVISVAGGTSRSGEHAQFWRQLALAGLIEGTHSGLSGSGGSAHCVLGTDCPRSKLSNAGWGIHGIGMVAGDFATYTNDYGNSFIFGAEISNWLPQTAVLKTEEAWNIDTKLDDGKPAYGTIVSRYWNNACATADDGSSAYNDLAASYMLANNTVACALYFRRLF